jgi:hypothetical protein
MKQILTAVLCLIGLVATCPAQEHAKPAGETKAAKFTATDGYPLDTCVVSGEALDDAAKVFTVEGQTFKTCCSKCKAKIEKDAKTWIAKKEQAVMAAQGPTYALTTCPISGKTLTDKAVAVVADNTLVKLCCPDCKEDLTSSPAAAVAKVQAAAFEKQAAKYSAKTCPVSGHDLDDKAVAVMHGTTLVKLCCPDCMEKFTANANAMAAKVTGRGQGQAKPSDKHDAKHEEKHGEKHDKKSGGHEAPAAAVVAPEQGGSPCCETSKSESGCCQDGAKKEGKPECCQDGAKKEAKPECCQDGAKAKAEPAKKIN